MHPVYWGRGYGVWFLAEPITNKSRREEWTFTLRRDLRFFFQTLEPLRIQTIWPALREAKAGHLFHPPTRNYFSFDGLAT